MRSTSRAVGAGFGLLLAAGLVPGRFLCAVRAHAAETTYQLSNELEIYDDTKQQETLLDDRLDALVSNGPYSLGASFLSHSPSNYSVLDPMAYGPQRQGIRKRWVEGQTDAYDVRVGDVYGTFGRGLALSIFEDQTVSFDNALDGAEGKATYKNATFQFVGGTNAFGTATQVLKAGRAEMGLPGGFRVGAEEVQSDYLTVPGQPRPNRDGLTGGLFSGSLGSHVDLYGEYVLRNQKTFQSGVATPSDGHAGYGNINISAGPLQLTSEYKDLLHYDLPKIAKEDGTLQGFVNPPTAVRQQSTTLLNRGSHMVNIRLNDEYGGLTEGLLRLGDKTRVTGSYSRSAARSLFYGSHLPAWETYGDIEQSIGENTTLILRADKVEDTYLEGQDPLFSDRETFGGTLTFPLTTVWSMEAGLETQEVQQSDLITQAYTFPTQYQDNVAELTLSRSPNLTFDMTGEWTNETDVDRQAWLWAEMTVKVSPRNQILVGGGSIRGGQVCSGGVCKLVAPFSGGRLEVLTTF